MKRTVEETKGKGALHTARYQARYRIKSARYTHNTHNTQHTSHVTQRTQQDIGLSQPGTPPATGWHSTPPSPRLPCRWWSTLPASWLGGSGDRRQHKRVVKRLEKTARVNKVHPQPEIGQRRVSVCGDIETSASGQRATVHCLINGNEWSAECEKKVKVKRQEKKPEKDQNALVHCLIDGG